MNYAEIGSTPRGVMREAVQHPVRLAERLAGEDNLTYLAKLFAPVAMLPAAALPTLLVAAPVLAANLLSSLPYSKQIMWHHAALVLAGIILATIEGVRRLGHRTRARHWLIGLALLNGVVATLAWGPAPELASGDLRFALSDAGADAKRAALSRVPDDASTSASYAFVPHLAHRRDIYEFPEPWRRVNWGVRGEALHDPRRVAWIVIDRQMLGPEPRAVLRSLLAGQFAVRYERGAVVVAAGPAARLSYGTVDVVAPRVLVGATASSGRPGCTPRSTARPRASCSRRYRKTEWWFGQRAQG